MLKKITISSIEKLEDGLNVICLNDFAIDTLGITEQLEERSHFINANKEHVVCSRVEKRFLYQEKELTIYQSDGHIRKTIVIIPNNLDTFNLSKIAISPENFRFILLTNDENVGNNLFLQLYIRSSLSNRTANFNEEFHKLLLQGIDALRYYHRNASSEIIESLGNIKDYFLPLPDIKTTQLTHLEERGCYTKNDIKKAIAILKRADNFSISWVIFQNGKNSYSFLIKLPFIPLDLQDVISVDDCQFPIDAICKLEKSDVFLDLLRIKSFFLSR